jgi:peptidoglycan-N-acetylglucosamine deacetylase
MVEIDTTGSLAALTDPVASGYLRKNRMTSVTLTFDDGPAAPADPAHEPLDALRTILRTLRANNFTAEFYVIGSEVKAAPEGARMIVAAGHTIQNHTWSHPHLDRLPLEKVRTQLADTQNIIKTTTGKIARKIRPPYGEGGWPGHLDPEIVRVAGELNLRIENWDIDTRDWAEPPGLRLKLKDIKKQIDSKAHHDRALIVLMHVQNETAADLPLFLTTLKEWNVTVAAPV